jgi:hypothetical protein
MMATPMSPPVRACTAVMRPFRACLAAASSTFGPSWMKPVGAGEGGTTRATPVGAPVPCAAARWDGAAAMTKTSAAKAALRQAA